MTAQAERKKQQTGPQMPPPGDTTPAEFFDAQGVYAAIERRSNVERRQYPESNFTARRRSWRVFERRATNPKRRYSERSATSDTLRCSTIS